MSPDPLQNPTPSPEPAPQQAPHPRSIDAPLPSPELLADFKSTLNRWVRRHRVVVAPRPLANIQQVVTDILLAHGETVAKTAAKEIDLYCSSLEQKCADLESKVNAWATFMCPACGEPRHPNQTQCWKCAHKNAMSLSEQYQSINKKLREYLSNQRASLNLAIAVLTRSSREKKKGKSLRVAKHILEATADEPVPPTVPILMTWMNQVAIFAAGMYAMFLPLVYRKKK